jgi:protein-tyrosine phosphatase
VLTELGGEPEGFLSRRLDAPLIACADLVLGLTREHREAAVRLVPRALRRCFVLEEFVRLGSAGHGEGPAGALREPGAERSGLTAAVARAAALRGRTAAPARADADDVPDPEPCPTELLRACAARIDRAVSRVADAVS